MEKLTQDQIDLIRKPLPKEAISQHPTKTYLSSIKAIYVTERLNDVFWFWSWTIKVKKEENGGGWMVVVHVTFEVPDYWFYYECFGGNDNWWENSKNFDLWDAYKWATTDAITKIASWIGIGIDVFKWKWWLKKEWEVKKDWAIHTCTKCGKDSVADIFKWTYWDCFKCEHCKNYSKPNPKKDLSDLPY